MCVRACVRACVLSENLLDFTTCDTRGIHKIIRTEVSSIILCQEFVKRNTHGISWAGPMDVFSMTFTHSAGLAWPGLAWH